MKPRILLVDDEPNILDSYGRILGRQFHLFTALSGEAGLKLIDEQGPFAVIISDFNMPRMDGIRFLSLAREKAPETVRMMLTGEGDFQIAIKAVNEGSVFRFLTKPCSQPDLLRALEAGVEQYRLIQAEKEARRQEIRIAGEIQQTLLFETPPTQIHGAQIACFTQASAGVDGDFLDFFVHDNTCFDLILGDVMGKGIPAALVGAGTKNRFSRVLAQLLRNLGEAALPEPEAVMTRVQSEAGNHLASLGRFVTLCYARFNTQTRTMSFVDAGHPPALWSTPQGAVQLKGEGFPLGFPESRDYQQTTVSFEPDDVFVFYSDGLMDGRDANGAFFGIERLQELIHGLRSEPAHAILTSIIGTYRTFVSSDSFTDDLTCVVVKSTRTE
ncbi:MAG TPA: SpoIIE family protein phosphatase [Candidatus Ozemobacteraceae bacterium]|nr:SpoIIE family protein phosphatase [Candidatus Ozemobacteraceae bacterium]